MTDTTRKAGMSAGLLSFITICALAALLLIVFMPVQVLETGRFVIYGLVDVAPLVIPGIVLAAWVSASGGADVVSRHLGGRLLPAILLASACGAVTPVCGVAVLPLMAALLASGVPLAPVMAFWLSSPVTDPAMFAATAAMLGPGFAVGKTTAAFAIGLLGGLATAALSGRAWIDHPLRSNAIVGRLGSGCAQSDGSFEAAVWASAARRRAFFREFAATFRLVVICLVPAFAAEHILNGLLEPETLSAYVGRENWWAVPLAVFVGAPAYVDGYAALPLTRSLMEHGMSPGAAMAFLVSGGVVSIWGALAIFPVLKAKPFGLFIAIAVIGSLLAGWIYGFIV
ncbi:permease [Hoeflea prorocentri]|uniref:Permease n=1 Tax=Hoeflea prorocentri TaxID=1922333 RepID=A0A9X3UK97_9HYPH|nr:permease [Hoeflea prorocentri]MCY6382878.1 permease [Hoeflea prorocentri]MDA5400678.1 permease [Hoeflea prorocentri]